MWLVSGLGAHRAAQPRLPDQRARDFRQTAGMSERILSLRGDHITLDALLKATGLAPSGGDAKALIASGGVMVNGEAELRRGRKLRADDVVELGGGRVRVVGAPPKP
jgi:ribosome-associated protein